MTDRHKISVTYSTYKDDAFLQLLNTDLNSEKNLVCNNGGIKIIISDNYGEIKFMFEFQLAELIPETDNETLLLEPEWFNYNDLENWQIKINHYYEFIITANKKTIKLELINPDTALIERSIEIKRTKVLINKLKKIYQKRIFNDNC